MDDGAVDGGEVGLRSVKPSTPNSERFNNTERGNQCWRSYLTLAAPEFTGTAFYQVGGMDVIDLAAPSCQSCLGVLVVGVGILKTGDTLHCAAHCWRVKKSSGLAFYWHGLDHCRARDWGRLWGVLAVHKLHL